MENQIKPMADDNAYTFSETHTKYMHTLNSTNYKQLTASRNITDLTLKLSNTSYRDILKKPVQTTKDLHELLDTYLQSVIDSYDSKENHCIVKYIKQTFMIDSFIYLLTSNKSISHKEIGFFDSLNSFLYINSLDQLFDLQLPFNEYLKHIKEREKDYEIKFNNEFRAENNLQKLGLLLHKHNLEDLYRTCGSETLRKILKNEGDRFILETLAYKQNIPKEIMSNYIKTECTSLSDYKIDSLLELTAQNFNTNNIKNILQEEVLNERCVLSISEALNTNKSQMNLQSYRDLMNVFNIIEFRLYEESFDVFYDISCVFSYIKIRESEVKRIKYIAECVEAGRGASIEIF